MNMDESIEPKKKMGRPKVEINERQFETCIQLPLTKSDLAAILGCSVPTIERYIKARFGCTFDTLREQKRSNFKKNILAKQYEMAVKGDRTMLIWLGKNYLEQSDKVESKEEINVNHLVEYKTNLSEILVESDVIETSAQISALPAPPRTD